MVRDIAFIHVSLKCLLVSKLFDYLCGTQQLACFLPNLPERTRPGQSEQLQQGLLTQACRTRLVKFQTKQNLLVQLP